MSTSSQDGTERQAAGWPARTCVGCRQADSLANLRRAVVDEAGRLKWQASKKKLPGRGAYVHLQEKCLTAAVHRGGFARSFRRKVLAPEPAALLSFLTENRSGSAGRTFNKTVVPVKAAGAGAVSNEDQENDS